MAWVKENKLEGLHDVFARHHIDESELACLLTDEQIMDLTDHIGLRLRLVHAISKEKIEAAQSGRHCIS